MNIKTALGCNLISEKNCLEKWVHLCFSVNRREGSPLPGKMFYPEWVSEKEEI